jgi:hypothetical protein
VDICGLGKGDDGMGNGHFEPSWIWLIPCIHSAPDMGTLEQVLDNSLQVEWSKCHAQLQCWEEEVLIIQEEMRYVIIYHEWRAQWWQSQAVHWSDTDDAKLYHGVTAYAEKQAHFSEQLAWRCAEYWLPALKEQGVSPEWKKRYSVTMVVTPIQHIVSPIVAYDYDQDEEDLYEHFEGSEKINDEKGEPDNNGNISDDLDIDY